jgi:signal transduction histidine kinase
MLLAGVAHGAAVLVVVAALEPGFGRAVAILAGAILLLLTRPLFPRLEQWLRARMGDPEALLSRLGGDPAEGVARTLRVRYAAVFVDVDGAPVAVASFGAGEPACHVPVEHRGVRVGWLAFGALRGRRLARARALAALVAPALAAERLRLQAADLRAAERARLGQDLHDRVGPSLAALKMLLHTGALSGPELADHAADAAQEVRRVLAALGPASGLLPAVEAIAARITVGGELAVSVESAGDLDALEPRVAEALYAIAVEALNNAVRHAGARTCRVRLEAGNEHVRLVVEDDGAGIPAGAPGGLGSVSMRRRATEIGGELSVTSGPGTRVEAIV